MYVLFFCATMLKGPHQTWRKEVDLKAYNSVPLREWFDLHSLNQLYEKMGCTKIGHMVVFKSAVINRLDPLFPPSFQVFINLKMLSFHLGLHPITTHQSPIHRWSKNLMTYLPLFQKSTPQNEALNEASPVSTWFLTDAELNADLY